MSVSPRRRRLSAVSFASAVILAACGAAPSETLGPADCAQADASGVVALTAGDLAFDAPCVSVVADQAFTIRLENGDSEPHNVAIYDTRDKVNEYLRGEIIDRDHAIDYSIDPLSAGEYYFLCTVHPVMNGPLFVGSPG